MSVKTVIINGKNVELFENDTDKTFLERVAMVFKLYPNFIEDINIKELKDGDDIKVPTLINDIQNYKYTNNPKKDVKFIKDMIEKYNKIGKDDVVKLFFSVNKEFSQEITDQFEQFDLIPLNYELKENGIIFDTVKFLKKDEYDQESQKDLFMKKIKQDILRSNEQAKKLFYLNKELIDIKSVIEDIKQLDIKKDECDLKIVTNIKDSDYSLSSIFSNIICRENTPFLSYNDTYKIYQDLDMKISDEWSSSFSNFMILKVHIDGQKYADCNILFENNTLVFIVEVKYKDFDHLSEDIVGQIIRNNVQSSFSNFSDFSILSETQINIYENVIIPDQTFNTYVLSDIIMNNFIFSIFLSINESIQTTKKKSGLYVNYFIKNTKGTCNITTAEDISVFPPRNIVRLRIKKALNQEIANEFIIFIGKLLNVYKKDENKIISFYKKYIPSFPREKVKKEVIEIPKLTLQKQVPDLFISGYPYKCQYPPIIIDDEEAKEYPPERVMRYPIKGEGKEHNYICKDDQKNEYIYVGLRENTLNNRNVYKYIPCCFKSDQTQRKGPYIEYFKGEVIEKGPQQNIIITNKLVRQEEYGLLPQNINKLLSSIDDSYTYLRKGVAATNISFLDCVLEAVLDISDYSAKPQKSKQRILYDHLNDLKEYEYLAVASQENPGETEIQLKTSLDFKVRYMDPSRWIKLCETVYKCKIIIISREPDDKNGIISIPNHDLVYLYEKYKTNQKLVIIYEHYGTYGPESNLEYPRCELVVKWEKDLSLEEGVSSYFFGNISTNIYKFYTSLISQYYYNIFNKKLYNIEGFDLQELKLLKPSHQIIDNYGKARGIFVNNFVLLSEPFPPIKAKILEKNQIYKENNLISIMNFFNSNNIEIQSQIIVNDTIKEINVLISGILFTAKIESDKNNIMIEDIKLDIIEKYPTFNNIIQNNINLKRLSYVISEYFIYYYSHYMKDVKDNKTSLEKIKDFIKNKVKITNKSNEYIIPTIPSISLSILEKNKFVISDKFIIENKEILKRLLYNLHVKLENNYNNVIDYYKNNEIYNFYKETSDFSENLCNIIVKDINDLQKIDNVIHDKIQTTNPKFFMSNQSILNSTPILFLKEETKEEAFRISSNWQKFNKIVDYEDPEQLENKVMFLYHSYSDVKIKKDIKNKKQQNSYILKYRENNEDNYLSIVPLI